jgi:hypothetical protein
MSLLLSQLLAPPPLATWRALLLGVCQGLGIVQPGGTAGGSSQTGTGSISLSGTPAAAYSKVVVKIVTAGELGTGVFQYSLDGGSTFSGNVTIPSGATYVLSTTGVTITFAAGPVGGGTSFAVGDTFTFALNVPGLGVTSWQSGGALRTLLEIDAAALADFSATQLLVAASGFLQAWLNPTAMGLSAPPPDAWLDLLGQNFYGLTRTAATVTQGLATLTAATGAGPYTIGAGTMWIADAAGHRYSNLTGGTLALSGTLQLTWVAESAGAAYNAANGAITNIVAGTLAGVTVANPDPGSGSWITSSGADAELSSAYATRCQNRWPALAASGTSPAAQFQLWALSAEAAAGHGTTIARVLVIADPSVAGQVDVYLASASGAAAGGAVTDANTYIQARVGLVNSAVVAAATNSAKTIGGQVNYFASKTTLSAVQAAVAANLSAYINGLPISDGTVKVYWTEIVAAIGSAFGVRDVASPTLNGGTGDSTLTLGQVATLSTSLTFAGV